MAIGYAKTLYMYNGIVAVTDDGIPYVQYLPKKTMKTQNDRREKKTPLMLFALEIVKRSGFKLGVLKYASGKSGYNAKIKKLLEHDLKNNLCTFHL